MLTWLHFGDLHASDEDGWQSLSDLGSLVDDVNAHMADAIEFVVLPGDNANHGAPEQYDRIRAQLDKLAVPWRVIPGDHDFEPGSLDAFYKGLSAQKLPYQIMADGRRLLFLDIISPGGGGPDFRLGADQLAWLRAELEASRGDERRPVVFMHAFPADLADGATEIGSLFAEADVACVDTGHTHYNELINDGRVIYTAVRSTGQVEEGSVGFAVACVDGSAVSWRFKSLEDSWPLVMITSPADQRLITDATEHDQVPTAGFEVHVRVFGAEVTAVSCAIDDGTPIAMVEKPGATGVWTAQVSNIADGDHTLTAIATPGTGIAARDTIKIRVAASSPTSRSELKGAPGHDMHTIGAWQEHGLLGSQLGPNKNGKKW